MSLAFQASNAHYEADAYECLQDFFENLKIWFYCRETINHYLDIKDLCFKHLHAFKLRLSAFEHIFSAKRQYFVACLVKSTLADSKVLIDRSAWLN